MSRKRHRTVLPGTFRAHVSPNAQPELSVKMPDRINLRSIFDLVASWVLLIAAAAGLVYVITIAATLRDLRALEPTAVSGQPDLEAWGCAAGGAVAEGEPTLGGAPQQAPVAERS